MIRTAIVLALSNVTPIKASVVFKLYGSDERFFSEIGSNGKAAEILGKKYEEVAARAKNESYERLIRNLHESQIGVVTRFDEDFPEELAASGEAYALFYRGNRELLCEKSFAVIGTRRITGYGKRAATFFAEELSESGVSLIGSGSDGAEYTALMSACGRTILCFPNGLNRLTNTQLSLIKKSKEHLELSLFSPDSPQMGYNFMQNNRLIARLCCGMLLIEAKEESGSKYTVECGLEFGKEIFALPGDIFSSQSELPNKLIKELKAFPATSASDILERLNIKYKGVVGLSSAVPDSCSPDERKILEAIRAGNKRFNDIVEFTGFSVSETASLLPMMELLGYLSKDGTGEYRTLI